MIIGFCGGTGAGKSTLVKHAAAILGVENTLIIAQDHYYKHLPELSFKQRCDINFDHPDALDFALMTSDIEQLKRGGVINRPVYSFNEHLRTKKTVSCQSKKYILVEGILVFAHQPLHALFDYKVYIDAAKETRVERRIHRDVISRGRTAEEVNQRFKTTLHSMHSQYIEANKDMADVTVVNNGDLEVAKSKLSNWLNNVI